MRRKPILFVLLFTAVYYVSCKDRYFPELESPGTGYLVVEGVLNAGDEATSLKIARTYDINRDAGDIRGETNAIVTVEGSDNFNKQLGMTVAGTYTHPNLGLDPNGEYRLRIKTSDGKEYLSNTIKVKITPAIDSLGYKQDEAGIRVYVNTHDPSNNTRYYKWNYIETWEYTSWIPSYYIYDDTTQPYQVRERLDTENIYNCWRSAISNSLVFGNSVKLTSDVISEQVINAIPRGNDKLRIRYSILVKQYAIDKTAYQFYELMKKNTESIGTIFDPQPSELRGNITCLTDPSEIVIGYIYASTVTQKRLMINRPFNWSFPSLGSCDTTFVSPSETEDYLSTGNLIPFEEVINIGGDVIGYLSAPRSCVDCRAAGGTTQRPDYW